MALTYEGLETAFRARNFRPLYFLYGEEQYLVEQAQRLAIEHGLDAHERDFNLDIVYGAEAEATQVIALCNSFPMMAARRVVVVRDFEKLRGAALFQGYAERPNPSAVVVLACRNRPNLTQQPFRALKAKAEAIEFKPLKPREVTGFVTRLLKTRGVRLEADAAAMLADLVGTDLQAAASEADKLVAVAAPRTTITRDDVLRATGQSREFNVFELQKAVGEGKLPDALGISERLLQQASNATGEALRLVSVLTTFFGKLARLAALGGRLSDEKVAAEIGVPTFYAKEYTSALARFGPARLGDAFAALLAADYELKGGSARDARLVVLLLLRRLMPAA
jgi:DNA polymerase III subunit delta